MLPMRPMKLGGDFIMFGENSLEYLQQLPAQTKRAFIVLGGNFMEEAGYLKEITDLLEEVGYTIETFNDVEPDPSFDTVQKGAKAMLTFEPDWIIAVGGGSVMDAAKAMWIFYEHPELKTLEEIVSPLPKLRNKAKIACIPTSSGTGSEVSRSIVITDKETHIKHGIGDMELMPDIAILEPKLTTTLPKGMTAATGMDALTHALEAKVSNRANVLADVLAEKAIKDVFTYLPTAFHEPDNLKAREGMLLASCIAGMSFTNVSLGIVHSLAHAIGGKFGVPHGLANAIILPYIVSYNSQDETAKQLYQEVADMLGVADLVTAIQELNKELGIPTTLQAFIKKDEAFDASVKELAKLAKADGCTKTNPVIPDEAGFEELFNKVYYGGAI